MGGNRMGPTGVEDGHAIEIEGPDDRSPTLPGGAVQARHPDTPDARGGPAQVNTQPPTSQPPTSRTRGTPDRIIQSLQSRRAQSILIFIIAVAALGLIMIQARAILIPIAFALVIGIVVSPVADKLGRVGVPRFVVASGLLFLATGVLVTAFVALEPLITMFTSRLPEIRAEIQSWMDAASGILRGIEEVSQEIERTVGGDGVEVDEEGAPDMPTVMDAIWLAPNIGSKVLIFMGTLFFFVMARPRMYAAAGRYQDVLFRADRAVARYFAAVTVINIGLGTATAIVLSLIGVADAILWGFAAGVLNFVLYLGPLLMVFFLLIGGIMQFSGAMVLAPPLAFVLINLTEAQFVTPAVVGQQMRISPLVVFLAIITGLWLWGPVGAIVALPISLWMAVLLGAGQPDPEDVPEGTAAEA